MKIEELETSEILVVASNLFLQSLDIGEMVKGKIYLHNFKSGACQPACLVSRNHFRVDVGMCVSTPPGYEKPFT